MSVLSSPSIRHDPTGIEQLAHLEAPISLTRIIKGMCFRHTADIVLLESETAILQTPEIHLYACPEGRYYLHSPSLPNPVRAGLRGHNLPQRLVVLSDFVFLANSWKDRLEDRVQPRSLTLATLQTKGFTLSASLIDLNPSGMGIFIRKRLAEAANLYVSDPVELGFRLPPHHEWKHLRGVIVELAPAGDLLVRAGIQFQSRSTQHAALDQYLAYRKEEIKKELFQIYCRALEPRRVEDLYF